MEILIGCIILGLLLIGAIETKRNGKLPDNWLETTYAQAKNGPPLPNVTCPACHRQNVRRVHRLDARLTKKSLLRGKQFVCRSCSYMF